MVPTTLVILKYMHCQKIKMHEINLMMILMENLSVIILDTVLVNHLIVIFQPYVLIYVTVIVVILLIFCFFYFCCCCATTTTIIITVTITITINITNNKISGLRNNPLDKMIHNCYSYFCFYEIRTRKRRTFSYTKCV